MLRDVQVTRTWISRGRFVRPITLAALILVIGSNHLFADSTTSIPEGDFAVDLKRFVYGHDGDTVFRTIQDDKIILNVFPLGDYSIEDVVNNLLPSPKNFEPAVVDFYNVFQSLAVIHHSSITIYYGTRYTILANEQYRRWDSAGWFYVVELGATIAFSERGHEKRKENEREYVNTSDQETICTQYIRTDADGTNIYSFLFIEHTDSFNPCLVKQILFKIGLRNIANDEFVDKEFDSTDLSQAIEFLLSQRENSGLTLEDFIAEHGSSTD